MFRGGDLLSAGRGSWRDQIVEIGKTMTSSVRGKTATKRRETINQGPASMELNKAQQLELLYFMRLTRSLEDRLDNLLKQGKIVGGLFRSLGQEATAVGSAYALDKNFGDILSPLTRDLGAMLVMDALPREVFAQYLARGTSPSGGA